MCTPLALGIFQGAIGAVGSVATFVGQQQQSKETERAAKEAWRIDQNLITQRQMQEEDALRQKQEAQNIEEAEVKASAQVGAIAGGISGISVDNILADVGRQASRNREVEAQNYRNIAQQLTTQRTKVSADAQSRINSAPRPSPLSLVAGIAGNVLEGANTYNRYRMA
jgi:hypothetical protein